MDFLSGIEIENLPLCPYYSVLMLPIKKEK